MLFSSKNGRDKNCVFKSLSLSFSHSLHQHYSTIFHHLRPRSSVLIGSMSTDSSLLPLWKSLLQDLNNLGFTWYTICFGENVQIAHTVTRMFKDRFEDIR